MSLKELSRETEEGLFGNIEIMATYQLLREQATSGPIREVVERIQRAGPVMVVDPEKALLDLPNTLERVRIAAVMGMSVIEVGGSTDNGEAAIVIPKLRKVVDQTDANTLLIGFPGTSSQVVAGLHAVYSLMLPQFDPIFRAKPMIVPTMKAEFQRVIDQGQNLGIPIIPVTYILFNNGHPTTVEKQTGIQAISVTKGVDVAHCMQTIAPWLDTGDLIMLELGSGPDQFANLGPVAQEIYKTTSVRPIVTGGISSQDYMAMVASYGHGPIVFGSVAERTPPNQFASLYQGFCQANPPLT